MSRYLRTTGSGLIIRTLPGRDDTDTGHRLAKDQTVEGHGESYDGAWTYVTAPQGSGWVSARYLEALAEPELAAQAERSHKQFAEAAGLDRAASERWWPHVSAAAARFEFQAPARLAMWIAQCGHESQGFTRLEESLTYTTAARIRAVWPSRFPTLGSAQRFVRQPKALAERVYGGRMGNGPEGSGDGWRYRGRGLIHLTGKDNYRAAGEALEVDLLSGPELVSTERYAALTAGWFWRRRGLNLLADAGEIEVVTRRINGGRHGLKDRRWRWERAKGALGVEP